VLGERPDRRLVAPARGTSNPSRRPRRLAPATRRTSARRKRRALSVRNQIVNDRPCVLTVLLIRTVMRFATTR
jgi:hypothetical protein